MIAIVAREWENELMKNVIIAATIAVAVGFGIGAWFFRGTTGGTLPGRSSDSQEEQMKQLAEMVRLQEEKLQKIGTGRARVQYDKLSADERRKNREHAHQQVMNLARKVIAEVALPPQEAKPFLERAEVYARSFGSLYYDEAHDEMPPEDRRRRLQELIDVLNQDMKQILSEEHYKQYWLIVRKYQISS